MHSGMLAKINAATILSESQAIAIFHAKSPHKARGKTSRMLSEKYGVTMKAVRDIWNFRTWKWETMPYWSAKDMSIFLSKHLCTECRLRGVRSLAEACKVCASPRPRGRPGIQRSSTATKAMGGCASAWPAATLHSSYDHFPIPLSNAGVGSFGYNQPLQGQDRDSLEAYRLQLESFYGDIVHGTSSSPNPTDLSLSPDNDSVMNDVIWCYQIFQKGPASSCSPVSLENDNGDDLAYLVQHLS